MFDPNDLQAIATLINESINPIKEELKELTTGQRALEASLTATNERLDRMEADIVTMKADIMEIKEDAKITRTSVNTLLDWAEDAQIEVKIPLYRKAQ